MLNDVFTVVKSAITQVFGIFDYLSEEFGFGSILLGFFTIFTITRLILGPVIGFELKPGKSDTAKSKSSKNSSKSSGSTEGD